MWSVNPVEDHQPLKRCLSKAASNVDGTGCYFVTEITQTQKGKPHIPVHLHKEAKSGAT